MRRNYMQNPKTISMNKKRNKDYRYILKNIRNCITEFQFQCCEVLLNIYHNNGGKWVRELQAQFRKQKEKINSIPRIEILNP